MNRLVEIFKKHNPGTQMSEEETRIAMNLMLSKEQEFQTPIEELDKTTELYKHFKPLIEAFQMQVFLSRLKHMTSLRITLGAFIMIAQHLNSAGSAVMHVFYLHHKLPANTLVDINVISMKLFPFGFFSDKQLKEIWDEQKVRPEDGLDDCTCVGAYDNLIDYAELWKL
jgi:hypothetical protein